MATIFDPNAFDDVTHDESPGLQTGGIPNTETGEDNDDNDILLSSIGGLLTTLQGLGAPATAIGAARNQVLTFVDDANPALKFRLFDGADSDGADPLLDSELTTLTTTAGDDPITLVRVNDTTIFGYANYGEAGERVAFALYLESIAPTATDPGGANITIVQYEAIHHPDAGDPDDALDLSGLVFVDAVQNIAFDDFSTAAAGQNLWNSVTDTATGVQLLFTGFELGSDTVNTSSFAIGSNNQSIAIGDGIVVDFVKGQTPARDTDSKTLSTINFNERVEGPSGGFTLVQTGGNAANRVGAEVFAYDSSELGSDYHDGVISGASQTIVAIEVWLGNTLVSAWTRADGITNNTDPSVTFAINAINDDGVIIQGLLVNYRVEFSVGVVDANDTGKLDRFSVQNVSAGGKANDTFDLGDIRLGGQEGDTAEVGSHIRFEDDGPTADAALGDGSVTHDETAGIDADADDTADAAVAALFSGVSNVSTDMTAGYAQGSASVVDDSLSDFGQDEEGADTSFSLDIADEDGTDSGLTTTDGVKIFLFKEGDLVVGRIGATALAASTGAAAFAVAIDADSGVLSLAQYASLWHDDDTDPDDSVSIASGALFATVTVTDGDDDVDTAQVDIGSRVSFEDDGPSALQPEDGTIENAVGATETGDLDDDLSTFAANFGEDGAGELRFTGMNDEVLADGAALEDANGNALFSNKVAITLSGFGTNVLTASAGATTVFTMTLDSVTGQYTMEMFAKIDDGSFDFDNFATAGAGNFTWVGVAGDEFPDKDLLVTGGNAGVDKVNNDSDDLAIGDQWIGAAYTTPQGALIPAEVIRIDFVELGIAANTGGKTLDTIDDIQTATHYDVNNVGFTIMQTQAGNPVDVRITAIDETSDIGGADIAADLTTSPAEIDEIVAVTIITNSLTDPAGTTYLRSGATEEEVAGVTRLVSRDGSGNLLILWDDDVDVDSVGEGYVIVYDLEGANSNQPLLRDRVFVATDDGFNRLEISNAEAVNSKHAFAIGDVEVGAAGQDIDLAFNGEIVDGDGDANSIGLIGVTVAPETVV